MTTFQTTKRSMLRPLAALLMAGMAGSVYANVNDDSREADELACEATSDRARMKGCTAAAPGATAATAAPQANEDYMSFGDDSGTAAIANLAGSMALGNSAVADGRATTAIGTNAVANKSNSTAIGSNSIANAVRSTAVGGGALVEAGPEGLFGEQGVAIGAGATVTGNGDNFRYGTGSVAIGTQSAVTGSDSVALGRNSQASEDQVVSLGNLAMRRRIINMERGMGISDAATIGQLNDTNTALGGGARIDESGAFVAPTYTIQGQDVNSVDKALTALDETLTQTNKRVDDLIGDGSEGGSDLIEEGVDGNLAIGKNTGGTTVDFAGTDGARVLTGVADGLVAAGSQQAVNGGQLASIRDELNSRVENLDGRVGQLEADAGNPGDGGETPAPGVGNDAGGAPIRNVGDGVAPSDAVNKGQLDHQVQQAINTANSYTDQRVGALAQELGSFKSEVNDRFSQQDRKIDKVGAMAAASTQMAINAAGVGPGKGRLSMGVGMQSGQKAMAIGYAKQLSPKVRMSVGGSFAGSKNQIGAGMGIDL